MDSTTLMVTVLSMVGVRLPVLIALCVGLVWVVGAPRDATRTGALVGLLLLLLSSLGGLAAGMLPMWLVSSGNFSAVSGMSAILGVLHFALAMVEAIGVVLLVWALVRLLRSRPPRSPERWRRATPGVFRPCAARASDRDAGGRRRWPVQGASGGERGRPCDNDRPDPATVIPGVTETVAAPRTLDDTLKDAIRKAYTTLQANTPGFSTRRSQSQMIGVVSRAVEERWRWRGRGAHRRRQEPGLPHRGRADRAGQQEEAGDQHRHRGAAVAAGRARYPNFLKATGLEATVALAKGRTRYLCTRNAAEAQGEGSQGGMFEDDAPLFDRPLAPIEMDIAKRLTDAFTSGSWDGDIDNAPETISPGLRSRITTPASGCAGRRCAYSAQCAVLRSRNTVRDAQIVVTNHALLLSALSIGDSDNGQPLIAPPSDMLLVLDEGHHIGNVAIDQGAASLALDEMAKRTGRLQILIAGAYRAVDKDRLGNLLPNEAIEVASNVAKQLRAFRDHVERVWMPAPADEEPMWRAANGRLPEPGASRSRRWPTIPAASTTGRMRPPRR
jgi:hypothetical protein